MSQRMKVLVLQYAGDFLAAELLRRQSGQETYYGHKYVLDTLARLHEEIGDVCILSCISDSAYSVRLPTGVQVVGAGVDPDSNPAAIIELIVDFDPTHVIVLSPMSKILRFLLSINVRILCVFADSFYWNTIRRHVRFLLLGRQLNRSEIEWVANHGRNSCNSLESIGVKRRKILPWDWPHNRSPADHVPRTRAVEDPIEMFYAGSLTRSKGVGDAIQALRILHDRGIRAALTVAGSESKSEFIDMAAGLGLQNHINFLGRVPNESVLHHMRSASCVLVPSHHEYPEGLPLTIYEALIARTPLVVSDHPMFTGIMVDGETALVHPEGRSDLLAGCVARLHDDPVLYNRLSRNAQNAWDEIQVPVQWGELVFRWCRDEREDRRWIANNACLPPERDACR